MTARICSYAGVDPRLIVKPRGFRMVFTVPKVTAREDLFTPGTGEVVDHPPDSPVHVPPRLQLSLQFQ